MTTPMRDGTYAEDPKLGRLRQFDERSRAFPIRSDEEPIRPRSYTWAIMAPWVMDQGNEGACVGFAVVNELQANPAPVAFGDTRRAQLHAMDLYHEAQQIDPWPGGSYPGATPSYEGTSVLAGVKAAQTRRHFSGYRWGFGLADTVHGVGHNGPAVLGINWHHSMYSPTPDPWSSNIYWVAPTGPVVGGHAILLHAVRIIWTDPHASRTWSNVDLDSSYGTLFNSWGPSWGEFGFARIRLTDLADLLSADGEAVFMLHRRARF